MPNKRQVDEIVKLITILKDFRVPEEEKMVAQNRLQQIKDDVTASDYGVAKDRIGDIQQLERVLNDPTASEWHKSKARLSIDKIRNESSIIRSMRKSLIREKKAGRNENVRDISEFVSKRSRYQNG